MTPMLAYINGRMTTARLAGTPFDASFQLSAVYTPV
jgi:hypothetical protein